MASIRSVCVYCGSQDSSNPAYADAARATGDALVDRGLQLVFGGGHVGMMGQLADRVLARGGVAIGVIPEALMRAEVAHDGLTELHVTEDMHQRKAMMAARSDAFITLPGGLGTLEEIFETWTWRQLKYHAKPVGLLNVDGYFDGLLEWMDFATDAGFVRGPHRAMLRVASDPAALLDMLAAEAEA